MENSGRAVVPAAFLSGILLSILLLLVTSGATFPPPPIEAVGQSLENPQRSAGSKNPDAKRQALGSFDGSCDVSSEYPENIAQWCELITGYARQNGLEPDLLAALILQESGGNASAYSHSGAVGLMQVMPRDGLAAAFTCANGPCFRGRPSIAELQDPEFNLKYGTRMLAGLVQKHGSLREALKYYGPMDAGYSYADKVLGIYTRFSAN